VLRFLDAAAPEAALYASGRLLASTAVALARRVCGSFNGLGRAPFGLSALVSCD
jgi:hypothetical protein